jgi:hypothetical protein
MKNRESFMRLTSLCLGLFCLAPLVQAQTTNWWVGTGTANSANYMSLVGNWSRGAAPVSGDILTFGAFNPGAGNRYAINNLTNNFPTVSILFTNSDGYQIAELGYTNKFVLNASGIYVDASVTNTPAYSGQTLKGTAGQNKILVYTELSAAASIINNSINSTLTLRQDAGYTSGGIYGFLDNKGFDLTVGGAGAITFAAPNVGSYSGGPIAGSGRLIKVGTGTVTLSGTNTYTGATLINQGQLAIQTYSAGGGSIAVADNGGTGTTNASLSVSLNGSGQTLKISGLSLTNNTGTGNTNTLLIALGALGNSLPSAPVINATNLTVVGNIYVTITGSGLVPGTIPLIQYTSMAGGGSLITNSIPAGVVAYLTNNTGVSQIQLVVQTVPSYIWVGKTNSTLVGTWDINGTSNWLNTASSTPAYFQNGLSVQFDDTGLTNLVTLATNLQPAVLTVTNNSVTYTFTNSGSASSSQIAGTAKLIKSGNGVLILGLTNSYSGNTLINGGTLQTVVANALSYASALTNNATLDLAGKAQTVLTLNGTGLVTNSTTTPISLTLLSSVASGGNINGPINDDGVGQITLNKQSGPTTFSSGATGNYSGGTHVNGGNNNGRSIILAGNNVLGTGALFDDVTGATTLTADSSPRTITNAIVLNYAFSFGSSGAGQLTLSGPVTFNGGTVTGFDIENDINKVIFSGPLSVPSGYFGYKTGPGTMSLQNNPITFNEPSITADIPQIQGGGLVLDNSAVTFSGNVGNFTVNGQSANSTVSVVITNNGSLTIANNLRLCSGSSPAASTNVVTITNGTLTATGVILGYGSTNANNQAVLNLLSGSQINVGQFSTPAGSPVNTMMTLDGATINAIDSSAPNFLSGMTTATIGAGGVTINGANTNNIHIAQNLLAGSGSGGLIWNSTNGSDLTLDGVNTYAGDTVVKNGTLGGVGTLAGRLVLTKGTNLKIGEGAANSIGTFTVNSSAIFTNNIQCNFYLNTTNAPGTNSYLVVTGTLTIANGNLVVINNGPDLTAGNKFKLFSQTVANGSFTNTILPALGTGLAWQNDLATDGSISVVSSSVPPPVLGVAKSGNTLTFNWTGTFKLQSQTNTLNTGLKTNWFDYPGGGTSGVSVTINPANPTVFFRLSQ